MSSAVWRSEASISLHLIIKTSLYQPCTWFFLFLLSRKAVAVKHPSDEHNLAKCSQFRCDVVFCPGEAIKRSLASFYTQQAGDSSHFSGQNSMCAMKQAFFFSSTRGRITLMWKMPNCHVGRVYSCCTTPLRRYRASAYGLRLPLRRYH